MQFPTDTFELILLSIFTFTWLIQLFYYLRYYLPVKRYKASTADVSDLPPLSVIICARDEEENLTNFLPSFLEQDYPEYEVIVVNDCSEDGTADLLEKYTSQFPNLKISTIKKDPVFKHGKKVALVVGIKAAKYDHLVFSDADCQPESSNWLRGMAAGFGGENMVVLGYGGYLSEPGLLNRYIRYDAFFSALQYLGMALAGRPYKGVGRNLAYRKSFFFESRGFSSHYHLNAGDDDLFVNHNARPESTGVVAGKGYHTRSVPSDNLNAFIRQKQRHISSSRLYSQGDKIILTLEPLTRLMYYTSLFWLLPLMVALPVVGGLALIRLIIQMVILSGGSKLLNEKSIIAFSIFIDIFSPLINLMLLITSRIRMGSGSNQWK